MSKHFHSKTEYCWSCGNAADSKCNVCGMSICSECNRTYHGKCDICFDQDEDVMVGSVRNEVSADYPFYI